MKVSRLIRNGMTAASMIPEAAASRNPGVFASFLGPALRGIVLQKGKSGRETVLPVAYEACFNWGYERDSPPKLKMLYDMAKSSQWNASKDIDWSVEVNPRDPNRKILPDNLIPVGSLPAWGRMSEREKADLRHSFLSWVFSQFLHGEQGALLATAQVTNAVPWLEGKLFGATQVVDEARHLETFHTYLTQKLEKTYRVNDNLYVVLDALMADSRWDLKFLGMQIMVEGLALGAFRTFHELLDEPLLKQILDYVIRDEARHVHYGVIALESYYRDAIDAKERRDREDWAYEVSLMLRNRFLAHELYEEHFAHRMRRSEWDKVVLESEMMAIFRRSMFKRIIPNLKRIGLLSDRVRSRYEALGVLVYEKEKAAPELTHRQIMEEKAVSP
ncbi:MAG: hypothetical protein AB1640_18850 [bacterium]